MRLQECCHLRVKDIDIDERLEPSPLRSPLV